jgi:hypothetical protein
VNLRLIYSPVIRRTKRCALPAAGTVHLPQRTEVRPRTTGDPEREVACAERHLPGCEEKSAGEVEVRVTGRALCELEVTREHRRADRLGAFRIAEELEAVEHVVAGEGAVPLLLAVRADDHGVRLELEGIRAHPAEPVVSVVHELHRRRNGIDGQLL